jgi:hypothetical protein
MASSSDVGLSTAYPKISDSREILEKKSLGIMRHEKWARKTDPKLDNKHQIEERRRGVKYRFAK